PRCYHPKSAGGQAYAARRRFYATCDELVSVLFPASARVPTVHRKDSLVSADGRTILRLGGQVNGDAADTIHSHLPDFPGPADSVRSVCLEEPADAPVRLLARRRSSVRQREEHGREQLPHFESAGESIADQVSPALS